MERLVHETQGSALSRRMIEAGWWDSILELVGLKIPKPGAQLKKQGGKLPHGTGTVAKQALVIADDPGSVAAYLGVDEDAVALQIDAKLNERVFAGTRVEDRLSHLSNSYAQSLLGEIEKSLIAQESYTEFEDRMLGKMGVDRSGEVAGPLNDMLRDLDTEVKLAWNGALVGYNQQTDTVLVWRAILDDRTTPACWENHGKTLDELGGETPPRHYGCRCSVITVPNPNSQAAQWADTGKKILEDMRQEREQGQAQYYESDPFPWQRPRKRIESRLAERILAEV